MYQNFLQQLWPADIPAGNHLLIWTRRPSPSDPANGAKAEKRSYWCKSVAEATNLLKRIVPHKDADIYLGCGLADRAFGSHQRCKAADIVAIPGLWLDMDVDDGCHKKAANLPKTVDEALALLHLMPLPPTLVVHSGGGIQGWWLFDQPVTLRPMGEVSDILMGRSDIMFHPVAAALTESWNKILLAHCQARGLTTDSVFDLARVMRLPGTWNVKKGTGDLARPTSILMDGGPRFSVEEVMEGVRGAEATLKPQGTGLLGTQGARDGHGSGDGRGRGADRGSRLENGSPAEGETRPGPGDGEHQGGRPAHSTGGADGHRPGEAGRPDQGRQEALDEGGRGHCGGPDHGLRQEAGSRQGPGSPGDGRAGREGHLGEDAPDGGGPGLLQIVDATIDNLCTIPKFEATWDRRRGFNDNSLSSYDGALALFCVNLDVEDRVIAEIIRQFRVRHGKTQDEVAKGSRADYIERTIRTAKEARARSEQDRAEEKLRNEAAKDVSHTMDEERHKEAVLERREARKNATAAEREAKRALQEELGIAPKRGPKPSKNRSSAIERLLAEFQAAEAQGESETQREALMREIGDRLGAKVERLVCFKAEPSSYVLHVEGEAVTLGGIENVHTYSKLALKVADAGVYFPRKIEGWDSIFKALHITREVVLVGTDGTDQGIMDNCVEGYLQGIGQRVREDVAYAVERREPFVKGGEMYIILSALRDNVRDLQLLSQKAVAAALVQWGAQPKLIAYTRTEGDAIVKTTTRAYLLPNQERWQRYIAKKVVSTGGKSEGEKVG